MSTPASPSSSPPAGPIYVKVLKTFYILLDQPVPGCGIDGEQVFDTTIHPRTSQRDRTCQIDIGTVLIMRPHTPPSPFSYTRALSTPYGYVLVLPEWVEEVDAPPEDAKDPYKRFALIE